MKSTLQIASLLLLTAMAAGQLASSHAPTVDVPPGAANTPVMVPQISGKPVARINGVVLTDRDLLGEMYAIFPYARQHNGFPKSMEAQIRQGALSMLIFEELLYQDAKRRNMTIAPSRMASAEKEFKAQFASEQEFQQFLKAEFNNSLPAFREKLQRSLLIQKMLKNELDQKAVISDADLKAYYEKHPEKFAHAEAFAIQSISILPPKNASSEVLKEAEQRANEAWRQAKQTKSYQEFGLLAEKVSDDDYRVNMGDHHTVEREKLPPEIVKAASAMKPGDVSDLLHSGNNYTFFRLNAHVPAGTTKLDEVKDKLRTDLQKEKYEKMRAELDKSLRKTAKVEML
jgi:peptidyl-prolyl cis-trans isomerase C